MPGRRAARARDSRRSGSMAGFRPSRDETERVKAPGKALAIRRLRASQRWKTVISALCCRNHRDYTRVASVRNWVRRDAEPGNKVVRRLSRWSRLDGGLLERRLDRLG